MNELAPITHGDPIAPVILGVTSILAFAVIGRVAASDSSKNSRTIRYRASAKS
jgi:hypothetical protein